ncbi:MAG TPA: polyprenyl diphosphate synthase [Bacillota bacterium]|jgi:undecaprenyl diphosphate synthase|nr:polyprenyl diphosphate synthase [Peptococcaceae bacterium MAG4]NLW38987.1 di-trans,poly-cis-decaprenylcistransferase [Peptococcaceae bacterium]HPZ43389.1 polyprenyl diphosphate synthase [Bacillota bacterium]HQD76393.1 polyprenyl diphosphate synthase [Bacillota bacterium]HUM58914.1 polyprenyl diphosphate synthase [Bacillota bacterium]
MDRPKFKRLPRHVGVIPDGNRRWSLSQGLPKEAGYEKGLEPGLKLYEICLDLGIEELTFYGFTQDNTKRPAVQREAFQRACVEAVRLLSNRDASLFVIGDYSSPLFPPELLAYRKRHTFGQGRIKVNFLVNYGWKWDLNHALSFIRKKNGSEPPRNLIDLIASADISRVDLIVRWGGRRRLSGFLPVQSIYADFYVVDELWPNFKPEQFYEALRWYETQDITLGG